MERGERAESSKEGRRGVKRRGVKEGRRGVKEGKREVKRRSKRGEE